MINIMAEPDLTHTHTHTIHALGWEAAWEERVWPQGKQEALERAVKPSEGGELSWWPEEAGKR